MKKIVLLSLLLSSLLLQADLFRLEMGAGIWSQGSSGTLKHKNDSDDIDLIDDLDVSHSQDLYIWALFKHPIPIIPNARIEYTNTSLDGKSDFKYNGVPISYELGIEQFDAILYYNLLDNLAWITIDLGLDINFMNQSYKFADESAVSDLITIPLLFGRGRFQIPKTGFALETEIKYMTYADSTVGDVRVKVDYTFDTAVIQPALELGYRHEVIQTSHNDFSDLRNDTDIIMSGVYLGVMLRY